MVKTDTAARERITSFFDPGTFVEIGTYLCRAGRAAESAGVICGYGAIDGRLIFAFSEDISAMSGAVDERHAVKIAELYAKARRAGAPVVGMFDSAGAMVFDGAAALGAYGKLLSVAADAKGKIPQIALISGVCAGTMAVFAELFDLTVAIKGKSKLYLTSPALCEGKTAGAEELYGNGSADLLANTEAEAFAEIRRVLNYLPDNATAGAPADISADDPNRPLDLAERCTAKEALGAAVDSGSFTEIGAVLAEEVQCGFATLGGLAAAVLALDGELSPQGVAKMRKLLQIAGDLDLPVVSFVNCTGLKNGAPDGAFLKELGALTLAWARTENAKVTALTGSAIGAGFLFGGARKLGADMVYALPGAEVSSLQASTAVAFLWNDRITPEVTREALESEWKNTVATAENAAASGEVDDVVAPAELRARIVAALYMLANHGGI